MGKYPTRDELIQDRDDAAYSKASRHNEGPWCDDCRGYTHAPWCPSYRAADEVSDAQYARLSTEQPASAAGSHCYCGHLRENHNVGGMCPLSAIAYQYARFPGDEYCKCEGFIAESRPYAAADIEAMERIKQALQPQTAQRLADADSNAEHDDEQQPPAAGSGTVQGDESWGNAIADAMERLAAPAAQETGEWYDHDDPRHIYHTVFNPSGCDKFYCLKRFDATYQSLSAEQETLRAALLNAKRCLERSDRSQLSVRKAIEKADAALNEQGKESIRSDGRDKD